VSSRTRPPDYETEYYTDDDYDDGERPLRSGRGGGRGRGSGPSLATRRFGLPIVGAALVGGLLLGYIVSSGGGGTTTITATKTVTAPAAKSASTASGAASRPAISLVVLNGSGESGLAARTAESARTLGYTQVQEGNTDPVTTDKVLFRPGAIDKARQVADDLGLPPPVVATAADGVMDSFPSADVWVELGPTSGAALGTGDSSAGSDGAAATPDGMGDGTATGSSEGTGTTG
jgi:hypothetical protein